MTRFKQTILGLGLSIFSISSFAQKSSLEDFKLVAQPQKTFMSLTNNSINMNEPLLNSQLTKQPFYKNKRTLYSGLWAYASLNYLYADLMGMMDSHMLNQYLTGEVEGLKMTPQFLTVAGAFMQIPLANVALPHLIKNDKMLKRVQIVSGTIMTLVQTSTLFIGKPSPYYALLSGFEIATTSFITIDAIRWKAKGKEKKALEI